MAIPFTRAGVATGLRSTAPLGLPIAAYGAVFGVLAQQAGASLLEATLLNLFVFAGAAQMAVMSYWEHPLPLLTIVTVTALINLRLLLLTASLRPWLKSLPGRIVYPMLHNVADESWSVAMLRYRLGERDAGVVLGCNLVVILAWFPATIIGFAVGGRIGDPADFALDFAFTAVFAAMLFGGYRGKRDLAPWLASGIAAWLVWWLVPGTWYVLAGGVAGVAVALLRSDDREHVDIPEADAEVAP